MGWRTRRLLLVWPLLWGTPAAKPAGATTAAPAAAASAAIAHAGAPSPQSPDGNNAPRGASDGSPKREESLLRVATLNLAHGRGLAAHQFGLPKETFERNIDAVADLIAREGPDVLALQEADGKSAWSGGFHHVERLADRAGYDAIHHGIHFETGAGPLRIAYGTAILARRPLRNTTSQRFAFLQLHTKGFVTAELGFDGRPVTVVSVHLSSTSPAARRREVALMTDVLRKVKTPLIVMGDLNSRWSTKDSAVHRLARMLSLQAYKPDKGGLATFRANRPHRRIDWILISRELAFDRYHVWPDKVSDHLGVAADLRWRR